MRRKRIGFLKRECQHARTMVASSAGVRRSVCQKCGHISFEMTRQPTAVPQIRLDRAG